MVLGQRQDDITLNKNYMKMSVHLYYCNTDRGSCFLATVSAIEIVLMRSLPNRPTDLLRIGLCCDLETH
jgi:hypothetical protein